MILLFYIRPSSYSSILYDDEEKRQPLQKDRPVQNVEAVVSDVTQIKH
jgi:hypothetical protein